MNKIMLVEDDATMLSLLQTLLQLEGFEVCQVNLDQVDGIVSEIRREKPDLTLIDVHLRQISGMEVLKQIRQDVELKDIFVLMSSGMDVVHKCLQAGADGFILKPYMPDDLIKKISDILNGIQISSPEISGDS
jgi:DNA-binding response OmpR family regulator